MRGMRALPALQSSNFANGQRAPPQLANDVDSKQAANLIAQQS